MDSRLIGKFCKQNVNTLGYFIKNTYLTYMKNVKFRCWELVESEYKRRYPILDISNEFPPNLKYDLYIGEINGQEIYENDIVNVPFGTHGSGTKSRKEQIFLARVTHTGGFEKLSRDISESHYRFYPKFNQIINKVGNIYEIII